MRISRVVVFQVVSSALSTPGGGRKPPPGASPYWLQPTGFQQHHAAAPSSSSSSAARWAAWIPRAAVGRVSPEQVLRLIRGAVPASSLTHPAQSSAPSTPASTWSNEIPELRCAMWCLTWFTSCMYLGGEENMASQKAHMFFLCAAGLLLLNGVILLVWLLVLVVLPAKPARSNIYMRFGLVWFGSRPCSSFSVGTVKLCLEGPGTICRHQMCAGLCFKTQGIRVRLDRRGNSDMNDDW